MMDFAADSAGSHLLYRLGVEEFRAGGHITRDERRWKTGEFWITKIWYAELLPSFSPPVRILCARATEVDVPLEPSSWHRAALARTVSDTPSVVLRNIDVDPVEEAVRTVPLIPTEREGSLDGTSYSLSFETVALSARISFANPRNLHLRAIERALTSLARALLTIEGAPEWLN